MGKEADYADTRIRPDSNAQTPKNRSNDPLGPIFGTIDLLLASFFQFLPFFGHFW
jgi:hypothetical protein